MTGNTDPASSVPSSAITAATTTSRTPSTDGTQDSTIPTPSRQEQHDSSSNSQQQHQGVLYKRRDVFQKRWRPRWFVLQPRRGILTYYLLSQQNASTNGSRDTAPTPLRNQRTQSVVFDRHAAPTADNHHHTYSPNNTSVDYDVVPRGTIYLPGCHVTRDDALSQNGWFVFKITPPDDDDPQQSQQSSVVYLSATSEVSRNEWMEKLSTVCGHSVRSFDEHQEEGSERTIQADEALPDGEEGDESRHGCYPGTMWKDAAATDDEEAVHRSLEGVPSELAERVQAALRQYLPLSQDSSRQNGSNGGGRADSWKKTLDIPNGVAFYQRSHDGHAMIKTVGVLRHHPKQLFNLLADIHRRRDFEENTRESVCLQKLNKHTNLSYYAYRAVWPTTARDFAVLTHWRILQDTNGNRAICILGFSDPAADELRPPVSDHVRAKLFITMTLLRLVDTNRCHLTRILSYDLCGSLPKSLTTTILQQQASMPVVLTQHLTATEPEPEERLTTGELTNESVIADVIDKFPNREKEESLEESVKRRLKFDDRSETANDDDDSTKKAIERDEISILLTAVILLTPLILYRFADNVHLPGKEIYFCLAVMLALRAVVLGHLGRRLEFPSDDDSPIERVTCHLTVDLKGVLRFIANRREEQEEDKIPGPEVSIIHIVLSAIAKAMKDVESLKSRRVSVPVLGIDGHYLPRGGRVDISLLLNKPHDPQRPEDIATLHDVGAMSVQDIVERVEQEKERIDRHRQECDTPLLGSIIGPLAVVWDTLYSLVQSLHLLGTMDHQPSLGSCLVVASPDSDHAQVDIDASVVPQHANDVNVVVVVGGVRLLSIKTKDVGIASPTGRTKNKTPPPPSKPTLVLAITIECPNCSVAACRQFAERVQNLVQFPEICDE